MKTKIYTQAVLGMLAGALLLIGGIVAQPLARTAWGDGAGILAICGGSFLLVFGLLWLLDAQRKNAKGARQYQAHLHDERNKQIRERAAYWTNIIMIPTLAIVAMICVFLDMLLPAILIAGALVIQVLALLLITALLNKKY